MSEPSKLVFEESQAGRCGVSLPGCDVPERPLSELLPPDALRSADAPLPEVSELQVVRHFTRLSQKNMGVDTAFYPLGSCTMKFNPKVNEAASGQPGLLRVHPYQPTETVQGILELLWRLERFMAEIAGMDAVSLQPAAGAHGELAGLMVIRAYFDDKGERRERILVPDSAHGTNPASCTLCGLNTVQIKSDAQGGVDIEHLKANLDRTVAALMITNPSTLGLFERNICEIVRLVHEQGALVYLDGANLNAIMGITRPGDFGVDVLHFNPHKTFATPHGGGGPGAGPIGVKAPLAPFLPVPRIVQRGHAFALDCDQPKSIGKMRSFYGNIGVLVRAYCYLRSLGPDGLKEASQHAVLNARYLLSRLRPHFDLPYDSPCMHEFVLSASRQKQKGVRALDIAKCLIDLGFHPPTIYFPLIVPEALMIEPTETESKETLDAFADALIQIAREAEESPDKVTTAPHVTPVSRLDEVKAARELKLRWKTV
ncbi:MAG: glycine dehydrogenase subunit 2 [Planctomycetes bacterium]|nr:glycine dehydrogenase subunit 2 [Planctomycetota bacterium]